MLRFRFPFPRPAELHRDIDDELEAHLAAAAAALEREGLSPAEARDVAEARLGDRASLHRSLYRIDHRSVMRDRTMTALRELRADIVFALRRMRRRPLLPATTITTLALSLATAITFVGAADAILLRPLPVASPTRVLTLWRTPSGASEPRNGVAPGTLADLAEASRTVVALAGAQPYSYEIEREGEPLTIGTWLVTERFFDVLRTAPVLGRLPDSADVVPGGERLVVVSHAFWRTHLGGDSSVIGRTERLSATPHRIVAVLPADYPYAEGRELYVPMRIGANAREDRESDYWSAYALIRDGLAPETAREELVRLAHESDAREGASAAPRDLTLLRLDEALLGAVRDGLALLALGAVLLLLMASVNTSSLLLADTMGRARELAVRASVGAGRERIMRQLLTETVVLASAAGVIGLALGGSGLSLFRRWAPGTVPRLAELTLDMRVSAIAAFLVFCVAVLVGLAPARVAGATDLQATLKGAADPGGSRGRRFRSTLVSVQVALAVLLLCSGGLLVRSWVRLTETDQGYDPHGVLAFENHASWRLHPSPAARDAFVRELTRRLAAEPDVEAAAVVSVLPLAPAIGASEAEVRRPGAARPSTMHAVVGSPGMFDLLRIARVNGRTFTDADGMNGEKVIVLSETAASRLFPDEDPVGGMVELVMDPGTVVVRRVIGVVRDVRFASLEQPGGASLYLPHAQVPVGSLYLATRHRGDASAALRGVQRVIRDALPGTSLNESLLLEEVRRAAGVPRRFAMLLLGSFAAIALLLTAVGLFGLLAQVVRLREREMGIRLALGAWPTQLRAMMLREGLKLVSLGVVAGLVLFVGTSGVLRGMLFGVSANDPLTIVSVTLLMLVVAACSSWGPATLATRVSPLRALNAD